jgi:glycosyltransferase involved in cell wall biosynthesis
LEVIIINNNSTDNTIKVTEAGAVLSENRKGYGYACLKEMEYIRTKK